MEKRILEKMQSYIYDKNIKFDRWIYEDYKKLIKLSPNSKRRVINILDKYCRKSSMENGLEGIDSVELAKYFYYNIINNTKKNLPQIHEELIEEDIKKDELLDGYQTWFEDIVKYDNSEKKETELIKIYYELKNLNSTIGYNNQSFYKKDNLLQKVVDEIINYYKDTIERFNNKYGIELNTHESFSVKKLLKHGSIRNYIKNSPEIVPYIDKIIKESLPEHPKDLYKRARSIKRRFVIHFGETNSGKTYEALEELKNSKKGVYLAPLRLLALEVYERLNAKKTKCNLLTGEEELLIAGANHISSTIEKLNINEYYNLAVIDEAQLLSDRSRGWAWTRAILGVYAREIHICCSYNAIEVLIDIIKECQDEYVLVEHFRKTPLILEREKLKFPDDVIDGDALIVFSRRKALSVASALDGEGIKSTVIYGSLPPDTRRKQVESFLKGETNVVVSTDAIGMGINLPIKRIVFLELNKYDGFEKRMINTDEILQIAGRAGRRGIYNKGFVNSLENKKIIKNAMKKKNLKYIDEIYVFPDEELFKSIDFGSVYRIMLQWNNFNYKGKMFKKSDLSHNLELLKCIYIRENENNKSEIYRLCCVPFDESISELKDLWKIYSDCILNRDKKIEFPKIANKDNLEELELYYKKLDLYFNMSKVFKKEIQHIKLISEKKQTSQKIHEILLKDIKSNSKYCDNCGVPLPWNSKYSICKMCHES
ncbi:MAG: DEAD/DEAH box helicase [Clostridiales bacterium]